MSSNFSKIFKNIFSISLLIKERRNACYAKLDKIVFSISLLIKERRNDGGKINLSISLLIKDRRNDAFQYDSISLLIKERRFPYDVVFYFFTHKGDRK